MIEAVRISKQFHSGFFKKSTVNAVQEVSLSIKSSETVAVLGPSGCGKSTLARLILGLLPLDSGEIFFEDRNISSLKYKEWRKLRLDMQLISQHPDCALDPRFKIISSLKEPLLLHRLCGPGQVTEKVISILKQVGLSEEILNRYPHQVSGGQIQRALIARALLLDPRFLVLDEPTSMLDVSVQAQVLGLLKTLQQEKGLGYLFITHDLDVAVAFSDSLMIMNQGKVIEQGPTRQVVESPKQAYTQAFIKAFSEAHRGSSTNSSRTTKIQMAE